MTQQVLKLKVIGIPHIPSIIEINARPDAGTNSDIAFKISVGTTDIMVIDVKEDIDKKQKDGKVYQWFQAQFAEGVAWVRDDLVEIWGDGSTVGYGIISTPTQASTLTRQAGTVPQGAETQSPSSSEVSSGSATQAEPSTANDQQSFKLKIIGIPHIPSIVEINARPDARVNGDIAFKVPVGTTDIIVLDVKADIDKKQKDGKVYQWFQAQFAEGVAWVRDDLVEIWGDGTAFGYSIINISSNAFALTRGVTVPTKNTETQSSTGSSDVSSSNDVSSEPATVVTGPAMAKAMTSFPAKIRSGAGTSNTEIAKMTLGESCQVLDETQLDQGGNGLHWLKVNFNGQVGWTREDLVRLSGNFKPFGLNAPDRYPSPAPESTWIRGWDKDGSIWRTGKHDGWDHAGQVGKPLLAGPQGGVVFAKEICRRCGDQGASVPNMNDFSVLSDPAWNFGYGHYVIVGYENSKLPASTRAYLESEGHAGQHIFVMYAHCHQLLVEAGQTLSANQPIATLGNSGFSTGAHLHLEVRISPTMSPQRWAVLKKGLRSPGILFLR